MARYGIETKLSAEEAIEKATAYFGEGGLGLTVIEQGSCCVRFEGGGGHVYVAAGPGEGTTTLDLETREWDYHVKRFMRALA